MPVRIYEIAKKLGWESKQVLAKAKSLGITTARVASSSLDKITAEYLELEILKEHPELAEPAPVSAQETSPIPVEQPTETAAAPPVIEIKPVSYTHLTLPTIYSV